MKVTCLEKEITGYTKSLVIEHEGESYNVTLFYHSETGYELEWRDNNGKLIDLPEWADKYDNGQRSLDYNLDVAGGFWEYSPTLQEITETEV